MKNQKKIKPHPTPTTSKQIRVKTNKETGELLDEISTEMVEKVSFKHQYLPTDVPLKEKPKPIKNPFIEDDFVTVDETQDNADLNIYTTTCCIEECTEWGTSVQVTKWVNGTGYEIILCNKGTFQHLSITKEEMLLVNQMIKKLD